MPETRYGYLTFLRLVFHRYTRRAILGATLMIAQSFLYNAIFFTCALVLINFYHVPSSKVPLYGLAFSIGNLAGPLVLAAWSRCSSASKPQANRWNRSPSRSPPRTSQPRQHPQWRHRTRYYGVADGIPTGDPEPFVGRRPVFHTFRLMKRAPARGGMVS